MSGNIEFVTGQESHSSNWGKYYVKGLESWQVKEDFSENSRDNHSSYQGYVANNIPDGTVFTIFEQSGNKRGTETFIFSICVVTQDEINKDSSAYGSGFVNGNYKVICTSDNSKTKAPRLMDWWTSKPADADALSYAKHCAEHINKRGLKELPAMLVEKSNPEVSKEDMQALSAMIDRIGKDKLISVIADYNA